MRMEIKKSAVAIGICVGLLTPFVATVPNMHRAEAAIAVFDQANIAKTIEVVTNTVEMITHLKSQIELLQKCIKNMDVAAALNVLQGIDEQQAKITGGEKLLKGIGTKEVEAITVWQKRVGLIKDLKEGNMTPLQALNNINSHHELIFDTTTDAVDVAKQVPEATQKIIENTKTGLKTATEAEGTKEAIQGTAVIEAQGTMAQIQEVQLMSQLVYMNATEMNIKNYQQAANQKVLDATGNNFYSFYKNSTLHELSSKE